MAFLPFLKITRKAPKPGLFADIPTSVGEHLKRRRLELGLRQQDVAAILGVTEWTVINWETGARQPRVTFYPAIARFLGLSPSGAVSGTNGNLDQVRRMLGLSWRGLAHRIGVDEGTLLDWQRGRRKSARRIRAKIGAFLASLGAAEPPYERLYK